MRFMGINYYTNEDLFQRLQQKDLLILQHQRKNSGFKKNSKEQIASKIEECFTILSQDESIFTTDAIFRKKMGDKERNMSNHFGKWNTSKNNHF